ncbi:hypothetical protein, partial [Microbulbifer mangrovi]|uniref:hypothetical protein n=1 Tax=Microbulbifer mangrovi TaxID=927787 RepID=UPI00195C605D
ASGPRPLGVKLGGFHPYNTLDARMEEGIRPALLNTTWGEMCASQLHSVLARPRVLPAGFPKTLEHLAIENFEKLPSVIKPGNRLICGQIPTFSQLIYTSA